MKNLLRKKARRARLILLLDEGHTWADIREKLACNDAFISRKRWFYASMRRARFRRWILDNYVARNADRPTEHDNSMLQEHQQPVEK